MVGHRGHGLRGGKPRGSGRVRASRTIDEGHARRERADEPDRLREQGLARRAQQAQFRRGREDVGHAIVEVDSSRLHVT